MKSKLLGLIILVTVLGASCKKDESNKPELAKQTKANEGPNVPPPHTTGGELGGPNHDGQIPPPR